MSLATTLKQLRLRSGLSLQAVADKIDASKAHVWELEQGKSQNPTLKLLKELADLYKVPLSRLIGELPDENAEKDDLLVMFRDLKGLDEGDIETLKNLIEAMKNKQRG